MYKISQSITGEVFDDPLEVLNDFPLMTLKDKSTGSVLIDQDLDEWLIKSSLDLELVYNPKKLSRLCTLKNINQAKSLLFSDYWDGNCSVFSERLLANYTFVSMIVKSDKWDGRVLYFSEEILKNKQMISMIIKSDKWDGDYFDFPEEMLRYITCLN